uniref:ABC transporter permease n=1 Tax=Ophidocladus simpliciusculus TaxID=1261574 RepID=A0A1Z1MJB0_9FLOR|nr:hypothetical protein [Ophidocladus simpliciusculus]ARW65932.1 hypothetical protein [Ophidocladus simpliciusculus]
MYKLLEKVILLKQIFIFLFIICINRDIEFHNFFDQLYLVGVSSLSITMITAFFISLVFSFQIIKEFLYLNAVDLIGSILSMSFIRELSPVLTAVIFIGKVGAFFTSELATMSVTEQIDALFILGINPIKHLIAPRVLSVILMLPLLNLFFILTSLISSCFFCFLLYSINPIFFFRSVLYDSFYFDLSKSLFKTIIFALSISLISCIWGITTSGGAQGVGLSTTASVVISLISIFVVNFFLSYFMFNSSISSFQVL